MSRAVAPPAEQAIVITGASGDTGRAAGRFTDSLRCELLHDASHVHVTMVRARGLQWIATSHRRAVMAAIFAMGALAALYMRGRQRALPATRSAS